MKTANAVITKGRGGEARELERRLSLLGDENRQHAAHMRFSATAMAFAVRLFTDGETYHPPLVKTGREWLHAFWGQSTSPQGMVATTFTEVLRLLVKRVPHERV